MQKGVQKPNPCVRERQTKVTFLAQGWKYSTSQCRPSQLGASMEYTRTHLYSACLTQSLEGVPDRITQDRIARVSRSLVNTKTECKDACR
eukprot:5954506-Amphidinium_carterae.1